MPIDEILKLIRKELNISQERLARELNVSFATMNRWENKKSNPSRMAIIQIKEYCGKNGLPKEIMSELEKYRKT